MAGETAGLLDLHYIGTDDETWERKGIPATSSGSPK